MTKTVIKDFLEAVTEKYKIYFNDCMCIARVVNCLGAVIFIDCYLAKNKTEFPNNISHNDPMKVSFKIDIPKGTTADDYLPDTVMIECYDKCYAVKPENKYLYCDLKKVPFRKTTGDPDKILKTLDKFFAKLHDSMVEDYKNDNMLEYEAELFKKNVIGD